MATCPSCGRETPGDKPCPKCLMGFIVQDDENDPPMSETEFINLAIQKKLATFEQVQECLKSQSGRPIWDVMVERGILKNDQVSALMSGKEPVKTFVFGPYSILGRIGEGGMGTVYKATKQGDRKVVALKVLPERFSKSDNVKRFEREAQIAISLSHPNIVKGYEHGQVNGRWYYSMEFVQGQTLTELVVKRKKLEQKAALQIAVQLADALESIHQAGLVHRDIKPDNILIGEDGVAKLMDLGLVKSTVTEQTALTQSGYAVGTLHYMSPEQAMGKDVDIRSDIYSLGATLYYMVTGRKPFSEAKTPMEVIRAQTMTRLPNPKTYHPSLTDSIGRLIDIMTLRDPALRYANPAELGADLRRVIEGKDPEHALVPAQRVKRPTLSAPAPSKKGLWIGVGMAGVVLAVGAGVYFAAAKPKPEPRVEKPIVKEDPARRIEDEFMTFLTKGRFAEASGVLDREASRLTGSKLLDLRKRMEDEAGRLWSNAQEDILGRERDKDFAGARNVLQAARSKFGAVSDMNAKMDARAKEIDQAERTHLTPAADPLREAEARFRPLEDSIRVLVSNQEYDRAIGILEGARAMGQDNSILVGMIDARIKSLRDLAKAKPAPSVEPIWKKALADFDAGHYDESILALGELVQQSPREARAYGLRAMCFHRKKLIENAVESARQAVKIESGEFRANFVLGQAALAEAKFSDAVSYLTSSITGDPTQPEAYLARARAWIGLRGWAQALRDLDQAARKEETPETAALRVRAYEGSESWAEAIVACGAWLKIEPTNIDIYLKRATLNVKLGQWKEAKADYAAALKIDPKNKEATKGRDDAELALKPKETPPEPKEPTAAQIKKKLADRLNASSERFTALKDGKWSTQLVYDFARPEELKDFSGDNFKGEKRGVTLEGSSQKTSLFAHDMKLVGDFQVRLDFVMMGPADESKDIGLRTTTDPKALEAPGVGVGLIPTTEWQFVIGTAGKDGKVLSPLKPVPVKFGVQTFLVFKREGDRYSAAFGNVSIEGEKAGFDSMYLRLYSRSPVRLVRFEIQGTIDPDWVNEGEVKLTDAEKKALCGSYWYEKDGQKIPVVVSLVDGVLKVKGSEPNPIVMVPLSKTRFRLEGATDYFAEFAMDKGKPRSLTLEQPSTNTKLVLPRFD